jgi:hypothetical protein
MTEKPKVCSVSGYPKLPFVLYPFPVPFQIHFRRIFQQEYFFHPRALFRTLFRGAFF